MALQTSRRCFKHRAGASNIAQGASNIAQAKKSARGAISVDSF
jgi:hypothetical protein